jgi:nucleoside-diphosphate-sugar epimerase
MAKLVTGGSGFIGSFVVRELVRRGEEVVVFCRSRGERIRDVEDKIKIVQGDISDWAQVMNVVKENRVDSIYHMAAMLSLPSEVNPWASFRVNVVGSVNILEAARLFDVNTVLFASTAGTYGLGIEESVITDITLQRPTTMYGSGKVYVELLGRFYRKRFGLDFRSVRIPSLIGPGITTRALGQYNSWIIEESAMGRPYECYGPENEGVPLLYFKDLVVALWELAQKDADSIKTMNYNITGISRRVSPKEIEMSVKKYIPDAVISYNPDPAAVAYFKTLHYERIDDTPARVEWGWEPAYESVDAIVQDFIKEVKERPQLYGLA